MELHPRGGFGEKETRSIVSTLFSGTQRGEQTVLAGEPSSCALRLQAGPRPPPPEVADRQCRSKLRNEVFEANRAGTVGTEELQTGTLLQRTCVTEGSHGATRDTLDLKKYSLRIFL